MTLLEAVVKYVFEVDEKSKSGAETALNKMADFAKKALGAIGIGFSLVKLNEIAEEFKTINDGIRNATSGMGDQMEIQDKILESANRTRSAYGDTAKMVSNLVQENSELFGTVDEALQYNETVTKLFKAAGKGNEQIAGLMEAINKSFAKGYVDSETMSQLLEQAPEAVQLLNDKFGVTSDKLEEMASTGAMTVKDLKDVFLDNADAIDARFGETAGTITEAMLNIRQQWGLYISQLDKGSGTSKSIAQSMIRGFNGVMAVLKKLQPATERLLKAVANGTAKAHEFLTRIGSVLGRLVNRIGGVENAVRLLGIVAAALFLYFNFKSIINGFKLLSAAMNPAFLKIALIVGAIAALLLVAEDFFHFMKGNDSVIGKLFEKAGVDAEKARQSIANAWNNAKNTVLYVWNSLKEAGGAIFGALGKLWQKHGDKVIGVVSYLVSSIIGMIGPLLNAIVNFFKITIALIEGDWATANELAKQMTEDAINAIKVWWDNLPANIKAAILKIVENIKAGFQQAIDWLKGLPDQAVQWGKDFIGGLGDGIQSGIDKVVEKVKGLGEKIKGLIHFSRPDEGPLRDYESWMPDFMAGLARGIEEHSPEVLVALDKLTGAMAKVSQMSVASPKAALSAVKTYSRNIVQNVNIANSYNGERNVQKTASKAMNKSAADATTQMANALKYQ